MRKESIILTLLTADCCLLDVAWIPACLLNVAMPVYWLAVVFCRDMMNELNNRRQSTNYVIMTYC